MIAVPSTVYLTRADVSRALSRLMLGARARSEGQARRVLARLWNFRDGALVQLAIPAVPESFAGSLTLGQRRWLLDTGRAELAQLPPGALDTVARLKLSRFYGGTGAPDPGAKHTRRITFPMLAALLGIDAARVVATEWAGKHLPHVEALDARHPDPEEAARIHGRQLARAVRQRAAERAQGGGLHVVAF
jgi:hypothetical protein